MNVQFAPITGSKTLHHREQNVSFRRRPNFKTKFKFTSGQLRQPKRCLLERDKGSAETSQIVPKKCKKDWSQSIPDPCASNALKFVENDYALYSTALILERGLKHQLITKRPSSKNRWRVFEKRRSKYLFKLVTYNCMFSVSKLERL